MSIKKFLLETAAILIAITCSVITVNSLQIRHNASKHFNQLQEEYFDTTYQIYHDEIVGNLLLNDKNIQSALFNEISRRRKIGLKMIYQDNTIEAGNITTQQPVKTYVINLGNEKKATLALYPINDMKNPSIFDELIIPLLLESFLLILGFIFLWRRFTKRLLSPLSELVSYLKKGKVDTYQTQENTIHEIKELSDALKIMSTEIQKNATIAAEVNAAKQVGHDIRSPLACLILSLSQMTDLPEEQRVLMRSAIQRITDIANSLHSKAQKLTVQNQDRPLVENFMVSSLVDSLISEKRMQVRDRENIQIDLNLEKSYGLFSQLNPVEFKRVLSNLINNSIEAFDYKPHLINVIVAKESDWILIKIQDDGKGIEPAILQQLGQPGLSYGKELLPNAGTGLGINHATTTIKSFGGTLQIDSSVGIGTTVTIKLPQASVPDWFVEKISLTNIQDVFVLDDDQSIYNLWRDRFRRLEKPQINLTHFSCSNQFKLNFLEKIKLTKKPFLLLVDFELINQTITGLDLVEELNIAQHAVLVTSYHEDTEIIRRCHQINMRIIPKSSVAFVPIEHLR